MFETIRVTDQFVPLTHPDYMSYTLQRELLQPLLTKHFRNVLDFGAGNSPYRELIQCEKYTAADITQNVKGTIDVLLDKDSTEIPLETEEFDLVLCMDVLEHTRDDVAVVKELFRVMSPSGVIVISIPFIYREHEYPYDYRRYTSVGIAELLSKAGFSKIETHKQGNVWQVIMALWFKRRYLLGEKNGLSFLQKVTRKFFSFCVLPILNLTVFRITVKPDEGIFARLLVLARKTT